MKWPRFSRTRSASSSSASDQHATPESATLKSAEHPSVTHQPAPRESRSHPSHPRRSRSSFQRPTFAQQREQRRRRAYEEKMRNSIITPSGVKKIATIDADRPTPPRRKGFIASLREPVICYFGFIICVAVLLIIGLVMVFSSSSVDLIAAGRSPYSKVVQQSLFAFMGVVAAILASQIPVATYRHYSFAFFVLTLFLQLLTLTPLGASANGNSGWIVIGPINFQPAELLKLSLCLWMPATIVSSRNARIYGKSLKEQFKPYAIAIGGVSIAFILVILGKDLGTDLIILLIGAIALLCGGLDMRLMLIGLTGIGVGIVSVFVTGSANRMDRIRALTSGCKGADDKLGVCYQVVHGRYALASGGLFGLGLGASREKWSYLPEAQNDFIFAVIGEELGFVGAMLIIILFALIAWFLISVAVQMKPAITAPTTPAARASDHRRQYARLVIVCIMAWICFEALLNIMVVLQVAPVIGVPLPFVSAGGTALVSCLTASGVATAMMREQPDIAAVFPQRLVYRNHRSSENQAHRARYYRKQR